MSLEELCEKVKEQSTIDANLRPHEFDNQANIENNTYRVSKNLLANFEAGIHNKYKDIIDFI